MKKGNILLFILSVLVLFSCTREKKGDDVQDSFDRKEMTTFMADDYILPAFQNFKTKSMALDNNVDDFFATPNEANLTKVRASLHQAYIAYQYIGFFRFGKADHINYQYRLNTYPVSTYNVRTYAQNETYDFRSPAHISNGEIAQGLPAIDYMVNGFADDDAGIMAKFTTDQYATQYKAYLKAIINEMIESSNEVLNDWNSGYRDSFVENQSNNAAGSLSLIVNAFVSYYESDLRAGKIGYPAGVLTPMFLPQNTDPKPQWVEARYSNQYNREYALEGLKAMKNFFNGVSFDGTKNGKSLKHYIEYLDAKQTNLDLANKINTNFNNAKDKISALEPSFVNQMNTDIMPMKDAYQALQSNVVNLKVSMPQVLNVSIAYMDTDGD